MTKFNQSVKHLRIRIFDDSFVLEGSRAKRTTGHRRVNLQIPCLNMINSLPCHRKQDNSRATIFSTVVRWRDIEQDCTRVADKPRLVFHI